MESQKSRNITKEDVITWAVIGCVVFLLICLDSYGFDVGQIISSVIGIMFLLGFVFVLCNDKPKKVAIEYPEDWDEIRRRILERDSYTCCNCWATNTTLHVHHIVPLSCGGSSQDSNLVVLCENCHKSIHPHMR